MKTLFIALLFATASQAQTTPDIDPDPVRGIYVPVAVSLDGPGTVTWNTAAVAVSPAPYASGPCTIDTVRPGNAIIKVGFTCAGPGYAVFTSTGQLTSTCPYDGGTLQGLRLTLALDGEVFYNEELWPNPVLCYVTPAPSAVTSWVAPLLTFSNAQARPSASTTFTLADAAWNYSAHVFTISGNVACSSNLVNIGTRFAKRYIERGFKCAGVIAANSVVTVTVQ